MTTDKLDIFIPLLLISRGKTFRDSYSLTKVLAWKFDLISSADIIKKLIQLGLITESANSFNSQFDVTNKGIEFIESFKDEGKILLLEKFNKEKEFISILFL